MQCHLITDCIHLANMRAALAYAALAAPMWLLLLLLLKLLVGNLQPACGVSAANDPHAAVPWGPAQVQCLCWQPAPGQLLVGCRA